MGIYGSTERGGESKLGFLDEKKRKGFETEFVVAEVVENVRAEALGKDGKTLVSTDVVKSEIEVLLYQAKEGRGWEVGGCGWEHFLWKVLGLFGT